MVTDPPARAALAPDSTDLGRLQRALLDPKADKPALKGDGSFLLLEADTPLEAAELTASLARTRPLADATFVVATEPATLDAALARQGLPTLGLSSSSHLRPHLQVLPLRLALAFKPQDPVPRGRAAAPPGSAARRPRQAQAARPRSTRCLASAARSGSRAIDQAVADETRYAAERGETPAAAEHAGATLRARIEAWFGGDLYDPVEGIPAAKAAALCSVVATWAGGRVSGGARRGRGRAGRRRGRRRLALGPRRRGGPDAGAAPHRPAARRAAHAAGPPAAPRPGGRRRLRSRRLRRRGRPPGARLRAERR